MERRKLSDAFGNSCGEHDLDRDRPRAMVRRPAQRNTGASSTRGGVQLAGSNGAHRQNGKSQCRENVKQRYCAQSRYLRVSTARASILPAILRRFAAIRGMINLIRCAEKPLPTEGGGP